MFTFVLIILGLGYTRRIEEADALSVVIGNTPDHRVRLDRVTFTDGVTCDTLIKDETVKYNTFNDATAAWASFNPPFRATRGRNLFIDTDPCVALTSQKFPTYPTFLIYMLILPAALLDVCILKSCCECYEEEMIYAKRRGRIQPTPVKKEMVDAMESV